MIGQRVKFVRSSIVANLGTEGTIIYVFPDGDLDVLWDREVFAHNRQYPTVHFMRINTLIEKRQVKFL